MDGKLDIAYALPRCNNTPRQLVPASSVVKLNMSGFTDADVRVGAIPPGHRVLVNQLFVLIPPLVYSITSDCALPVSGGFAICHVTVPAADADTVKKLDRFKSSVIVVVPFAAIVPDVVKLISVIFINEPENNDPVIPVPTSVNPLDEINIDPVITADPLNGNPAPVPLPPVDAVVNNSLVLVL